MKNTPATLLLRSEPYPGESFAGYLLRLTELNHFGSLSWIITYCNLEKGLANDSTPGFTSRQNVALLSKLSDVSENILRGLLYEIDESIVSPHPQYFLFNRSLPAHYIFHRSSRICPACLHAQGYLKQLWEFSAITICPIHDCYLIDSCLKCRGLLVWKRSKIGTCKFCSYRMTRRYAVTVKPEEQRITRQIYKLSGLQNYSNEEIGLNVTLQGLDLRDFLRLIFFFASSLAGFSDITGQSLVQCSSNEVLHTALNAAAFVFDDFPYNFYLFLDLKRHQKQLNIFTEKNAGSETQGLKGWKNQFERFQLVLEANFAASKFDFLLKALKDYLQVGEHGFLSRRHCLDDPELLKFIFFKVKSRLAAEIYS